MERSPDPLPERALGSASVSIVIIRTPQILGERCKGASFGSKRDECLSSPGTSFPHLLLHHGPSMAGPIKIRRSDSEVDSPGSPLLVWGHFFIGLSMPEKACIVACVQRDSSESHSSPTGEPEAP